MNNAGFEAAAAIIRDVVLDGPRPPGASEQEAMNEYIAFVIEEVGPMLRDDREEGMGALATLMLGVLAENSLLLVAFAVMGAARVHDLQSAKDSR